MLNLFYDEPFDDRWIPYDRFPRRIIRRLFRRPQVGGQRRVFLNLCAGLREIGIDFRVNAYGYARRNPREWVGVIGKACVLSRMQWKNPILGGACLFSHPAEDREKLLERSRVRHLLVPGEWVRRMWEPYWGANVSVWPVGIDTELWRPSPDSEKEFDVLLYDKVRWDHDRFESTLIQPIRDHLRRRGLRFIEIRYGSYKEPQYADLLAKSKSMIFLCEHETQGIAYQQALSCGLPILAWDRGGFWQDPYFYPELVKFEPVSSVPYWDSRCGVRFTDINFFEEKLSQFIATHLAGGFAPRSYIVENLTLAKCAEQYALKMQSLAAGAE
jgi:hypothetical protein